MEVMEAIRERRSIRDYEERPLPAEMIEQVLEAGRLAPSSSNVQSWKFKVVTDEAPRSALRKASLNQGFVEQAPVVIVACLDLEPFGERTAGLMESLMRQESRQDLSRISSLFRYCQGEDEERCLLHTAMNISIAVQNMVLAAISLGLGTCWVRAFEPEKVMEILSLPPENPPVVLLPIGFPNEHPKARSRKPMHEILL